MSAVYQIGVLPTGAVAPAIGTGLVSYFTGSVWPVTIYVVAMALITIVSLILLPETNRAIGWCNSGRQRRYLVYIVLTWVAHGR